MQCAKTAQYECREFICNIWPNELNQHFSNIKVSRCTNTNQIHNTDFFLQIMQINAWWMLLKHIESYPSIFYVTSQIHGTPS